jgi:hypothetical protein
VCKTIWPSHHLDLGAETSFVQVNIVAVSVTMFSIYIKFIAVLGLLSLEASAYSDSIFAEGLLGSHFGIPGFSASYDYVVVGGGTAGLTVARRLAANSTISVAIIEAGDFAAFSNGNLSQVPAYASYFTGNDPVLRNAYLDWYMYTQPQPVGVEWIHSVVRTS